MSHPAAASLAAPRSSLPALCHPQTKQYAVSQPGDLVQVDLNVRPLTGVVFIQFTVCDVVSRWDVIQRLTPALPLSLPFSFSKPGCSACLFRCARCRSRAVPSLPQSLSLVCQKRGLRLFVLPPRSFKLNGAVERANRTRTQEFCQQAVQKESRIEEGHLLPDHVHMMIAIPPKYAVSQVIGFI